MITDTDNVITTHHCLTRRWLVMLVQHTTIFSIDLLYTGWVSFGNNCKIITGSLQWNSKTKQTTTTTTTHFKALCPRLPSVLWRCWLGGRKGIRPVKNMEWRGAGVVICLERGANDLHMVQLMPLPPRHLFMLQQNPEWFILLVPAYTGCPGKCR